MAALGAYKVHSETVVALCQRKSGASIPDIIKRLGVSKIAAASLIGDARRKGVKVKYKNGCYYA